MGDERNTNTIQVENYVNNVWVKVSTNEYLELINPATDAVLGRVGLSNAKDVDAAVQAAANAFPAWSRRTLKSRADILRTFHQTVTLHSEELAHGIVQENGKNITEARAEIAKGLETLEYAAAAAVSAMAAGQTQIVSTGPVTCQDMRSPLGVVVCIVPFNFPFMVPMWTIPLALATGNTVVLKPSEKVPLTMYRCMELWKASNLPPGCLNMVQGSRAAVEALVAHPRVQAVTFVGSSPVAAAVSTQARARHVRCTSLGGAKNHLVAVVSNDACDVDTRPMTAQDIVVSFAGCAGQRCMAASVLLIVGSHTPTTPNTATATTTPPATALMEQIVKVASAIAPGMGPGQMGPVIDAASYTKILSYIQKAEKEDGAKVLLDGRLWQSPNTGGGGGNWIGPTILLHSSSTERTMCEEVFGPVLSIYQCQSWQEAIDIENASPFGNAAAIYTNHGGTAEWFLSRFKATMLGCNIGIPVPREPFSFGGRYGTCSKYGDMDITGDGGIEFFTHRIKISSKWPPVAVPVVNYTTLVAAAPNGATLPAAGNGAVDQANFAGSM